jgi:uncharacterized damage-inducible protein DinB
MNLSRTEKGEYSEHYDKYVSLITGTDILGILEAQRLQTLQLFAGRSERDGKFRYAMDKWSVKEVLGHMTDAERIFAYRALRIGRGDSTPLPGFEQDDYVRNANFSQRTLAELVEEFAAVRTASILFFRSLREADWLRRGVASKNEVTVRALAYIVAGHELYHRHILDERYFPAIPRA